MSNTSILGRVALMLGMNASDYNKGMKQAELSLKRFGRNMERIGTTITTRVSLPLALAGGAALKMASDAEETQNRFNSVFGSMSDSVAGFARELSNATGRSFFQIQDGLASFQGFAQGLGLSSEQAARFSKELQTLSIDFASFNNLSDEESLDRFISAMSGSSEVLDKFGVNLREANLSQKLLDLGLASNAQQATEAQKAIARLAIIRDVMGKQGAIGDAINTSDSFANQLRRLQSGIQELGVEVGKILIPVAQQVVEFINKMITFARNMDKEVLARFVKFAGIVAISGPLLMGLGALAASISAIGLPALALGAAIGAIAAAFIYVKDNIPAFEAAMVNGFRSIATNVIDSIQRMIQALVQWVTIIPGLDVGIIAGAAMAAAELKEGLPGPMEAQQFGSFSRALQNTFLGLVDTIGLFKKEVKDIQTPDSIDSGLGGGGFVQNTLGIKIPEMKEAIELTNLQIAAAQALGQAFDQIGEAFARTFVDGVSNLKNFGDAFKSLGQSLIETLKEIAVQLLKMAAIGGISKLLFPSAGFGSVLTGFDLAKQIFGSMQGASTVQRFVPGQARNLTNSPISTNLFIDGRQLRTTTSYTNFRSSQYGF